MANESDTEETKCIATAKLGSSTKCGLLLSSAFTQTPFVSPFLRPSNKPNLSVSVSPIVVQVPTLIRDLHTSIISTYGHCSRLLHLFASQNPFLNRILTLSSEFHRNFSQIQCRNARSLNYLSNQNFAAILPGDSVAGLVVANGISNFLNLYNTLLVVRLVLTWFPNSPPAIVSPLSTICDPYLNIFRGLIPPLGGTLDLSPILAFVVLNAFTSTAAAIPAELPSTEASQGSPSSHTSFSNLTTPQKKWIRRLGGNRSKSSSEFFKQAGYKDGRPFSGLSLQVVRLMNLRSSSYERLVAISLAILGVVSPLYIDRRQTIEEEDDEQPINVTSLLPLLLLVLIMAITLSHFMERTLSRFDPYWIHRMGGSSMGIIVLLIVLALVLKCKTSFRNWDV